MGGRDKKLSKRKSFFQVPFFKSDSKKKEPPKEFICPISKSVMADPVVVSSGHTLERLCVQVCKDLEVTPTLPDGSVPDFSDIIPNLAFKTTIQNWCSVAGFEQPNPPEYSEVESIISSLMGLCLINQENSRTPLSERELLKDSELNSRNLYSSSSSEESVIANSTPLLPSATRPSCFSSSSSLSTSSELVASEDAWCPNSTSPEDENFANKMKSSDVFEQEQAEISLRSTTRTNEDARVSLCSERLLIALKWMLNSRYATVQSNAAAVVVNLSLAKVNKIKIVRAGIVPHLIEILRNGFQESQEHAAGAIFSLAIEDSNRTAIGVLGALPPLLRALRSGRGTTRRDAAMALYHLTLVQSNREKIIRLGAIGTLLGLLNDPEVAAPLVLVVVNLAACKEGRKALLGANAVECLVEMIRKGNESGSVSTRENCVAVLYSLRGENVRFNRLARDANAVKVLQELLESGTERAKEKARKILVTLENE